MPRFAFLSGIRHGATMPETISGPDIALLTQREVFKQFMRCPEHPTYREIQLWESDAGVIRRHRMKQGEAPEALALIGTSTSSLEFCIRELETQLSEAQSQVLVLQALQPTAEQKAEAQRAEQAREEARAAVYGRMEKELTDLRAQLEAKTALIATMEATGKPTAEAPADAKRSAKPTK